MLNIILLLLLCLLYDYGVLSQSCDDYVLSVTMTNPESECVATKACKWVNGKCRCASEVKLDILFGVDTSGSIGFNGFQIQKQFIKTLVSQGVNNGSKIGFTMFNTDVNASRGIQEWDRVILEDYVDHIYWTAGWTNTPELLSSALTEFKNTKQDDRQQILMLLTDGNPCLPASRGGCPQSVCQWASEIKSAGVRVIIIGVGDGLNSLYVKCLTGGDEDYIPVASFSTEDFNSIMGSLSGILCPISKEFKVTEVKAQKKTNMPGEKNRRWGRFIEIYNTGIDFNLNQITLSGLVSGTGPDVDVTQGQYVVFYDASDTTVGTPSGTPSVPTCHLCGSTQAGEGPCNLASCPDRGDTVYAGYCLCDNSIYVACGNSGDGACSAGTSVPEENGCSVCTFQDSDSAGDWDIYIKDSTSTDLIDSVIYDPTTWILTDPGYSYELISKGFDNDDGDNWAQSCSVYGTPGSDPRATCEATCLGGDCGPGGNCSSTTQRCDCDASSGYYPQCSSITSCTKCKLVPGVDDCDVIWKKNGTERFAAFNWTAGSKDSGIMYEIQFFDNSKSGALTAVGPEFSTPILQPYFATNDYFPGNDTYGGFVRSVVKQCWDLQGQNCNFYYSQKVWCDVKTSAPTISPTAAPSMSPTSPPTARPTGSPTWPCPNYWWKNEEVCDPDRCYTCNGKEQDPPSCCLLEPNFNITYDPNRRHKGTYECKLDVELNKPKQRDDQEQAGSAPGYLLATSNQPTPHYFEIDIEPEDYPYTMDIFWRLEFATTDCSYSSSSRRRILQSSNVECDSESNDPVRAGLIVTPRSGWLTVHGGNDFKNASVEFTTQRADCGDIEDYLNNNNNNNNNNNTRRRRMASGADCLTTVAIYGNLVIVNATSRGQPNCRDGRIYPMRIPVWYNYNKAFIAPPSDERELPAWLWWLIAALVIFLALLAFLVYKYWWKNKATGAALKDVQKDLDAAVFENEVGFGADLAGKGPAFNPLATGFNPNAAAGPMNPNGPPNGNHGGGDFIRPNVEKPVYRQAYGQNPGNANNMHH